MTERPPRLQAIRPPNERTLIQILAKMKIKEQRRGAEPHTLLRAIDYAEGWIDNVEEENPTHPKLILKEREELIVKVYEEMVMGKHAKIGGSDAS